MVFRTVAAEMGKLNLRTTVRLPVGSAVSTYVRTTASRTSCSRSVSGSPFIAFSGQKTGEISRTGRVTSIVRPGNACFREVVRRGAGGREIHRQPVEQEPPLGGQPDAAALAAREPPALPEARQVELDGARLRRREAEV